MIYITGDTHCPIDMPKLSPELFDDSHMTKDDFLIISGDAGFVWNGSEDELWWRDYLTKTRNFTTLFVDGNHENHQMLSEMPVELWNGGKVHKVTNSLIHLMRGQVFEIDGVKIFTMGGATSQDKSLRTPGRSWWEEEMPSESEYLEARTNLERCRNKVDVIISHCAPSSLLNEISYYHSRSFYMFPDELTEFLEEVKQEVTYSNWYFGHSHEDINFNNGKDHLLYNQIRNVKEDLM